MNIQQGVPKTEARARLERDGFCLLPSVFTLQECDALIETVTQTVHASASKNLSGMFAIRRLLHEVPGLRVLLDGKLQRLLSFCTNENYFLVKSVWFDKPERSNWFVAWHQDLSISVDRKIELPGFGPWTSKPEQFGVQPPRAILENIVTLRIHLDDCDETNGALHVLPGSHRDGIVRRNELRFEEMQPRLCCAAKGDVLLMKPLLFHASSRAASGKRRRVIHLECASLELPPGLGWAERLPI